MRVVTVAQGLEHPWGMAFLPDGRLLVTERPGRLRIVAVDGTLGPALEGLPPVAVTGQGGLLDVALDPDFAHQPARVPVVTPSRARAATARPWRAAA